jgi:hypothetical protein
MMASIILELSQLWPGVWLTCWAEPILRNGPKIHLSFSMNC